MMDLKSLEENFSFLDDWDDKYGLIMELGRSIAALSDEERSEENRVRGCQSQVWLVFDGLKDGKLSIRGASDALIVQGLVAIILMIFSGQTPETIKNTDAKAILDRLGLASHLSRQRAGGLLAMVERIQAKAAMLL